MNTSQYNFDIIHDRAHSNSLKWDAMHYIIPQHIKDNDDVIPFWVADMDFRAPNELIAAMHKVAEQGIYGYVTIPNTHAELATQWLQDIHGWEVNPDTIIFCSGVMYGVISTILALTQPGDEILIFQPIYPPLYHAIIQHGRVPLVYELDSEGDMCEFDLEKVQALITNKTTLCIFCNPHNPSGRLWTTQELIGLSDILVSHNIPICSNDIHGDLVFSDYEYTPIASLDHEIREQTITCLSPSKTFNMGGQKIAHLSILNKDLRNAVNTMHSHIWGDHPFTNFGAVAFESLYTHGHTWYRELMQYLEHNRDFAYSFIKDHIPILRPILPHATYLLWIDFRQLQKDEQEIITLLAAQAKVCLQPGSFFGNTGTGYMRLNFACPQKVLQTGLERICDSLVSL